MRRRSRLPRPTGSNKGAHVVAIVLMGIVLFIVIKFRNTMGDNISSVLGAMGGTETSDLEVHKAKPAQGQTKDNQALDAGPSEQSSDVSADDQHDERSVTP